jgi:hypothetical protein
MKIRAEVWALVFIGAGLALKFAAQHLSGPAGTDLLKDGGTLFALGLIVWQSDSGGPTPPNPPAVLSAAS